MGCCRSLLKVACSIRWSRLEQVGLSRCGNCWIHKRQEFWIAISVTTKKGLFAWARFHSAASPLNFKSFRQPAKALPYPANLRFLKRYQVIVLRCHLSSTVCVGMKCKGKHIKCCHWPMKSEAKWEPLVQIAVWQHPWFNGIQLRVSVTHKLYSWSKVCTIPSFPKSPRRGGCSKIRLQEFPGFNIWVVCHQVSCWALQEQFLPQLLPQHSQKSKHRLVPSTPFFCLQ